MQVDEAKEIACQYYKRTGKVPSYKILREYLFLFKENEANVSLFREIINDSDHAELCQNYY